MTKDAVNKVKLSQMLRNGASQRKCAKHFNVSPGRISQIKKELNISVVKNVALENAHNIISRELDAVGQLYKINEEANRLLDELEGKPDLKLKVMAEIRGQLRLQLEIFQALYNMKAVQEFQTEILQTIGEIDRNVRDKIIDKLNQRRAIRRSVNFD